LVPPDVWAEVSHLNARFAWGIDHYMPQLAADQFIEGGRLIVPAAAAVDADPLVYVGRDAIRARWEGRTAVSRHAFVNLMLDEAGPSRLVGKVLLIGYRADEPGGGDTVPAVVSDFEDDIVLDRDGRWRFAERRATVIFARREA